MKQLPPLLEIPIAKYINEAHSVDFRQDKNVIGSSAHMYCGRKTIAYKLNNIKFQGNMRTSFGNIYEDATYQDSVIEKIIWDIYKLTGLKVRKSSVRPYNGKKQQTSYLKIRDDYEFRLTPDINTDQYCMEEKTTFMNRGSKNGVDGWDDVIADIQEYAQSSTKLKIYQLAQLNANICFHKHQVGFLYTFNGNAFTAGFKQDEKYWDKIHQYYEFFMPFYPDQQLYEASLNRVNLLFDGIETENLDLFEDSEFSWECGSCLAREICGKDIYICKHRRESGSVCYKRLYEFTDKLTEDFIETPLCENHYNELYPRRDYLKYKFGVATPKEVSE